MPTKRDDKSLEEELRQVWSAVDAFQAAYEKRLALYRSQRAWRVMLTVRKAYHLLIRRGPMRFSRWIAGSVFGADPGLDEAELTFPDLSTYLPARPALPPAPTPVPHETVPSARSHFPMVSILVVTYNSSEYLAPFFDSVQRNTAYPNYEVIVVDNASTDGSMEELERRAQADPRVRVARMETNIGFAGGNNVAARIAQGEFFALLNPDTIVTSGWLERLLRPIEADPAIGLAGPVSNFSDTETKLNTHYRSQAGLETFAFDRARSKRGETLEVDTLPLFCGLVRRSVWDELGGLDERFEIGMFEDDDFCVRIRKAEYRIVAVEDCFVHHFGHGSFGKLSRQEFERIYERNKKRFEEKWGSEWLPHKTRPGIRPVWEETRISVAEFFRE